MPQQINLFTPIQFAQQRYFSAQTMLQTLLFFMVIVGCTSAYWVWGLHRADEGFKKSLTAQSRELERLQAAITQSKVRGGVQIGASLTQELQARRTELLQREKLAQEWQHGLLRPGWGHAARLQLIAQSIPEQVWVTAVNADEAKFEVSGYTLAPSALNAWVAKLAASPLLEGQKLAAVTLENASATPPSAMGATPRPVWSFSLLSAIPQPSAVTRGTP